MFNFLSRFNPFNRRRKLNEALLEASYSGHTKIMELLLAAGANVHAQDDEPLRLARANEQTDTVKLLLDTGAGRHINRKTTTRRPDSTVAHVNPRAVNSQRRSPQP